MVLQNLRIFKGNVIIYEVFLFSHILDYLLLLFENKIE